MKQIKKSLCLLLCAITSLAAAEQQKPNVIVILADDLGYADLGCQGSTEVKTPHIDSLAQNGVRFTNGYVSSPQCGPSRAGLLSGRYQSRFGFESNEFARRSIPVSERLISERMKEAGYATGFFGKWGVGNKNVSGSEFIPPQRGFDESYWNSDGNIHLHPPPGGHDVQFYRGNEKEDLNGYSTDVIGREAVAFVKRHRDEPFFLFISHITPHVPMEAKEEDLARFSHIKDPLRRTMLAMMACLDDNVGQMLRTLREEKLEENTLIIFLSDNGAPLDGSNASLNHPFPGGKDDVLEGGIRIPYIMQWKGRIPAGKVYDNAVSSLDIMPTSLAAAGEKISPEWKLDGVNLLPFVTGENTGIPHETLYWRFNIWTFKPEENRWAIREGDWMLLRNKVGYAPVALYNLRTDPTQSQNLAEAQPKRVAAMTKKWEAWNAKNPELPELPASQRILP